MREAKKEYYDLVAYVKGKKEKIGYAVKTDAGSIRLQAEGLIDPVRLGRLLVKQGLYIQKRRPQADKEPEYQSAIDEYEQRFNASAKVAR